MKKIEIFKIEGDRIVRQRRHCPKCGDGVFLAEHKNRFSCGACGYTEFKGGGKPTPEKPIVKEEKLGPKQEIPIEKAEEKPAETKEETVEEPTAEPKQPSEEAPDAETTEKPSEKESKEEPQKNKE